MNHQENSMQCAQDAIRALLASTNARTAQLITTAATVDKLIADIHASGIETMPHQYSQGQLSISPLRHSFLFGRKLLDPNDTGKLLLAIQDSKYLLDTFETGDEFVSIDTSGYAESARLFIYGIDAASAQAFEFARRQPLTASEVQQ
ncbi:hypothetical protein ACPRNU_00985 [Chromobacterium vaccinii]|uniref:hypothetical protein n=1 Tax=Chromobacterium vaccinii TaxID=1108595 RepID=UPI003C7074CC